MPTAKERVAELKRRLGNGGKRKASEAFKGTSGAQGKKEEEGIAWMLKGLGKEKFLKDNWEKKGVRVKRGDEGHYKSLKGLGTVEQLWERMERGEVSPSRINVFRCLDKNTKETPGKELTDWREIKKYFDEGWSMQWLQPQHEDDDLARLVSILESEFGSLVGVNAYLTPAHVQGLAPHYDDVEVFVLQLSGSKRWSLHATTEETPLPAEHQTLPRFQSHDLQLDLLSPAYLNEEIVPGDLLYFPRGTIHYAPSVGDVPSVHLTISTYQRWCNYEVFQKVLEEAMAALFQTDPMLRQGIPWGSTAMNADLSFAGRMASSTLTNVQNILKEQDLVGTAVQGMSSDLVNYRMPPMLGWERKEVGEVWGGCRVVMPDATVVCFNEAMPDEEGVVQFSVAHSMLNDREKHMLGKKAEEEEEHDEEDEEEEEEEEEEENPLPPNHIPLPEPFIDILISLAAQSPKIPIALAHANPTCVPFSSAPTVSSFLSGIPKPHHPIIFSIVKELESLGILFVQRPEKKAAAPAAVAQEDGKKKKKKKNSKRN